MYRNFYLAALFVLVSVSYFQNLFAAPPTQPAANLLFTGTDGHAFNVGFTKGNGTRRIVIARREQPVTSIPINGKDYNHNNQFGKGDELNEGEFVVYDGEHAGFGMSGLSPATRYYFAVFEYNGSSFSTEYLVSNFATGSHATLSPPGVQASGLAVSNINGNSVKINWINGNGSRRLVVMREGGPVQVNPQDLTAYNGRPDFGYGSQLAPGVFVVAFPSNQTTTSVDVTELQPSTTYFIKIFEANGSNGPVYQPAGAPEISFMTAPRPTIAAKDLTPATPEGNVVSIAWKNGNGSRRMVVVREGQPHDAVPQDGVDYSGNDDFSAAPELAPGHKVIYHTNGFQWLNMKGAKPGTTYYFKVYESSGTGTRTAYRVADAPSGSFASSGMPTEPASNVVFSQATPGNVTVGYTPGNGTGRLVIGKAGGAVTASPQDLINYNGSQQFGSGQNLGDGNFVLNFGANTQTTVIGLTPGITYHYAVFEYNGNQARVYHKQPARGSFTQPTRPTVPSTQPVISLVDATKFRLTWTTGNGQRRLVIVRKGAPVSFIPADGQEYTAVNNFSQSTDLGEGHKAVYFGVSGVVDITGLEPGAQYHIRIFEAANFGQQVTYLTEPAPATTGTTLGAPNEGPKSFTLKKVNPTSANLLIVPGNGSGTLWVMREGLPVNVEPQDFITYQANAIFGSVNTELGTGNFIVHQSGNTEATISGLKPGTTYHVAAFEYSGNSLKAFNRTQVLRYELQTPFAPTEPASKPNFTLVDGGSMRVGWTNGNGTGRIVVARAGTPVDAVPQNNISYAGDSRFDKANELAPGQKVLYNGASGLVDISGLQYGTTYYFSIFEFTQSGDQITYLAKPSEGLQATLPVPTVQATGGGVTNVGATTATIGWTIGNGANRLVVLRKGEPVGFVPMHYQRYPASPSFSSAAPLPDGSRVVAQADGTQVNIMSLQSGTTYYGAIFEYNGNASPAYLTEVPSTFSFTTIGAPIEAASGLLADQQQNTSLRLRWTNGSGQRRLVIMRAGFPVNGFPQDNQRYTANSFFGSGSILPNANAQEAVPNYVVYNGEGKEVIVTNLRADIMYHISIIEFNDFGSSVMYQAVPFLTGTVSAALPLPLVLGDFKAQIQQGYVVLNWSTLQEHQTAYFAIEMRGQSGQFRQVGTVSAAGFSNRILPYQFIHRQPDFGTIQYRLRMVDKDGSFSYSPVVQLQMKANTQTAWFVENGYLHLQLGYQPDNPVEMSIVSMDGRVMSRQNVSANTTRIYLGSMAKGFYYVVLTKKDAIQSFKIKF